MFKIADSTGVSVLFSSGDDGDNFADFGLDVPDYPATDPLITAVGGTTLEVNRFGADVGQYGWSTAKQTLCARRTDDQLRFRDHPGGQLSPGRPAAAAAPATPSPSRLTRSASSRTR